jgi:polar amino acid transport system substrate-binding protein
VIGRRALLIAAAIACSVAGACATTSDEATDKSLDALSASTAPTPTTTAPTRPPCDETTATQSLRPLGPLPPPDQIGAEYQSVRKIRDAGHLVVGVDENTLHFGYRDPATGELKGLEIDLVREISQAIFGDPNKVRFVTVVTDEKVPFVKDGKVDMTVSVVSMTCDRWRDVAFSSEYFQADQKVMVRADSRIQHLADLGGKKVCVTAGSTTIKKIQEAAPNAIPYPVAARTDCLVALQEGKVDAIATHNTILAGLSEQDRKTTRILDDTFSVQDYGIPIAHDHPDLVRFVNAVLDRMRADNSLQQLYEKWLTGVIDPVPSPPAPSYQD